MIIESSRLANLPVVSTTGESLGKLDIPIWDGKIARLAGWQVNKRGVLKKFAGLFFTDVIHLDHKQVVIDQKEDLRDNFQQLDQFLNTFGKLINVTAKTESGTKLGRVTDTYIEMESGIIIRFVITNLWHERIIPRQFLVSMNPNEVIFKDIVNQPIFDQVASQEAIQEATAR